MDIPGSIPDYENVPRVDRASGVAGAAPRGMADEVSPVFCVGTKSAESKVGVQTTPFQFDTGTELNISRGQTEGEVRSILKILEKSDDSGQNAISDRFLNFFGKVSHISVKNLPHSVRGRALLAAIREDLPNDRRIGLSVGPDTFHCVDQANYVEKCSIKGADTGATCGDEGSVDIKEEQLHAAILRQGELFLRL